MKRNEIEAIGFDLDGTLYPTDDKINKRIRKQIAIKIFEKKPELKTIDNSLDYFEKRYQLLKTGTRVLEETGFENATEIMNECLANADILDLIQENKRLYEILKKLKLKYKLYIVSSSPRELSLLKLKKVGLSENLFDFGIFSDTPYAGPKTTGEAFDYLLKKIKIPPFKHIFIGDRESSDIIPAKSRGMKTIMVGGESSISDITIKNINEIENIFL